MANGFSVSPGGAGASQKFLALAEDAPGMPGRTTVATRSRLSIDDLPRAARNHLVDGSDPKGRQLLGPERFNQAADFLSRHGARLDNGVNDIFPVDISLRALRSLDRSLGYDADKVISSRVKDLVHLNATLDRWLGLPLTDGPFNGPLRKEIRNLVEQRKLEFVKSLARQDSLVNKEPENRPLLKASSDQTQAAYRRQNDLLELMRGQIKSGRADPLALRVQVEQRELGVVLRPVLRQFGRVYP